VRGTWRIFGTILLGAALATGAGNVAGQAPANSKAPVSKAPVVDAKKSAKPHPPKVETLACKLGTEDQHARIAVVLHDGKVNRFAYYSKWKPRTCSMEVERNDAYSKWVDTGTVTVVTLIEDKGAFLIDHERGRYHFIFREIDRVRYCGMPGKVSGSLTIFRGKPQCVLEGVMEKGEGMIDINKMPSQPPEPPQLPPGAVEAAVPVDPPPPASSNIVTKPVEIRSVDRPD
jgi:hypothetical protein